MPRLGPECGIFAPQLALPKAGQSSGYEHPDLHIRSMATASPSVEIIPECLSATESEDHRLDSLKEVQAMIRQTQSRLGFLHQQERALLARLR